MGWIGGLASGLLIGGLSATAFVTMRIQSLSELDFVIVPPDVPFEILDSVRSAENDYYAAQPKTRQLAEWAQDVATFLHPPLVYRMDFSVGPFRLKGKTLDAAIPWAHESGFLILTDAPVSDFHWLYVYLAEQPGLANWGAAVHLEFLRQSHPLMRDIDWPQIASDPQLIAKMYSGYLGAGGDWDAWKADLTPGKVALSRLGLAPDAQNRVQ